MYIYVDNVLSHQNNTYNEIQHCIIDLYKRSRGPDNRILSKENIFPPAMQINTMKLTICSCAHYNYDYNDDFISVLDIRYCKPTFFHGY